MASNPRAKRNTRTKHRTVYWDADGVDHYCYKFGDHCCNCRKRQYDGLGHRECEDCWLKRFENAFCQECKATKEACICDGKTPEPSDWPVVHDLQRNTRGKNPLTYGTSKRRTS